MNGILRYFRFRHRDRIGFGVENNGRLRTIEGDIFGPHRVSQSEVALEDVTVLSPCVPGKIIAVGLNYKDHAEERRKPIPKEPLIFMKPSTALIGPDETILLPRWAGRIDHEAELAVVIGRTARHVEASEADDYILGFTCFNDVTARELQDRDVQFTRAKSFDTFAPMGPCVAKIPLADIEKGLRIELTVNGAARQSSNTSNLIFSVPVLVQYISRVMTLLPGDVISTGTPSGIGRLNDGDIVKVTIESIGTLSNPVRLE